MLGMGYVVLLVYSLLAPARAGRTWVLPHVYAHWACLCKFLVQLHAVRSFLDPRLPQCPADEAGCFLEWLGLGSEVHQTPDALMRLMSADLVVLFAASVVVPLDLSAAHQQGAGGHGGVRETLSSLGWWRMRVRGWVESRILVQVSVAGVASKLSRGCPCTAMLGLVRVRMARTMRDHDDDDDDGGGQGGG